MGSLRKLSQHCRTQTEKNIYDVAAKWGIPYPQGTAPADIVDMEQVDFLSDLATVSRLSLPDFVRLVRGQTAADPQPNKGLYALPQPPNSDLHEIWRRWNDVVAHGVVPEWLPERPSSQPTRPRNHTSISHHLPQVWRHIRKGQRDGRYLVVRVRLLDQW